jgi:hypothetical protein
MSKNEVLKRFAKFPDITMNRCAVSFGGIDRSD